MPPIFNKAEMKKLILIPFLLIIQLQGSANNVCAIGKSRVLRETSKIEIRKVFSIVELSEEKVLTGKELTKAANT